jgi:hypothetical protein
MRCLNYFCPSFAIMLMLASVAPAQTNGLSIYSDFMDNGFQERGWAKYSLVNTSPVHSGSHSISISATEWQGIAFSRPEFDVSPYASLSFWANGGTNGGQRIQVQGLLGNATPPQNVYYRVTLLPNTWQKITVPLTQLGVADKTNFTDIWIQLASKTTTDTFYVDDIQLDAKVAAPKAESANQTVPPAPPVPVAKTEPATDRMILWIGGSLAVIIALLVCLVLLFWRRNPVNSRMAHPDLALTKSSGTAPTDSDEEWKQRALAAEAMAGKQGQLLREKIMPELTEFAKQSLVQGLYAQRNALIETQQKAQQALTELESRLIALQLPLHERIRAYEKRIAELEKEVETQGEEVRELTRATLALVRKKLEDEREYERTQNRFN